MKHLQELLLRHLLHGLDPTLEELADIKTAVSEAVTNCIIHAYEGKKGIIKIVSKLIENEILFAIR